MPRRIIHCILAFVALAALLNVASIAAQASPDLRVLALSEQDLGNGWRLDLEDSTEDGAVYSVVLFRTRSTAPPARLDIVLVDDPDRLLTPAEALSIALTGIKEEVRPSVVTFDYVTPALVGEAAAQARYAIGRNPVMIRGDALAWRRGPFVAVLVYETSGDLNVVPFALQQDAKLAAALRPAPARAPASSPRPASGAATDPAPGSFVLFVSVAGAEPGGMASATVQTAPGATCSIEHRSPSGTPVVAAELESQVAGADGRLTWRWPIGPATERGEGIVRVTCDGRAAVTPLLVR